MLHNWIQNITMDYYYSIKMLHTNSSDVCYYKRIMDAIQNFNLGTCGITKYRLDASILTVTIWGEIYPYNLIVEITNIIHC